MPKKKRVTERRLNGVIQRIYRFDNGYGLSVIIRPDMDEYNVRFTKLKPRSHEIISDVFFVSPSDLEHYKQIAKTMQ